MTDPTIRAAAKEVGKDATELLTNLVGDGSHDVTELSALVLIATAALSKIQNHSSTDEELRASSKRARKLLKEHVPKMEHNEAVESKGLDLGQYAHTKVFDGDAKKAEKFARLMGGAKPTNMPASPQLHATFAPSAKVAKKVQEEISDQFDQAINHKGKKGLGC